MTSRPIPSPNPPSQLGERKENQLTLDKTTGPGITAYRKWILEPAGRLLSLNGIPWDTPHFVADDKPSSDNNCGIYAWKDTKSAADTLPSEIWGEVELWGKIVEHEFGYRAEHALVRSLNAERHYHEALTKFGWLLELRGTTDETAQALRERYQCEVYVTEGYLQGDDPEGAYKRESGSTGISITNSQHVVITGNVVK